MNEEAPKECEACGATMLPAPEQTHLPNCIREYSKNGDCLCPVAKSTDKMPLTLLNFHGRKLWLCPDCYSKEQTALRNSETSLHEYQKNVPDRIEHVVQSRIKNSCTVARWQDLYSTERPNWVLSNFASIEDMKIALTDFITSMEILEWETRTKKRAAFDAAKELDARLSKEEREKLINDPNFQVPTNSEFKKIQKDREVDQFIKDAGFTNLTAKQRKSVEQLISYGLSADEIRDTIKK